MSDPADPNEEAMRPKAKNPYAGQSDRRGVNWKAGAWQIGYETGEAEAHAATTERCIAIVDSCETVDDALAALRSELSPPTTPESEGPTYNWNTTPPGSRFRPEDQRPDGRPR